MAIEGKGRWVTIAGRHIFVEEGETPMSAYVKQMASKSKSKTSKKNVRTDEEVKDFNRQINDFSKKIDEEVENFDGIENRKKQIDKVRNEEREKLANQLKTRTELIERFSSDKYKEAGKEYEKDQARKNKERVVKIGGENVIVKGDETPIAAFVKKKVGESDERKKMYKRYTEAEWEKARADFKNRVKELSRQDNSSDKINTVNSSNINEQIEKARSSSKATKILSDYLKGDDTKGMNSTPKYKENKFGVKDQALLHDENKNPSGSWIPTKQAMITYYKKRAKEENNQYYSDNAERLAEEYIKYREELKKKGRN